MKFEKISLGKFENKTLSKNAAAFVTGGGELATSDPRYIEMDKKTTSFDAATGMYTMKYFDHTGRLKTTIVSPVLDPGYPKP